MKKVIFITGPVKSGKSQFAVEWASKVDGKVVFVATAQALDDEMKDRIQKHQESRPDDWQTIEESINISQVLLDRKPNEIVILDCLTLWISNLFMLKLKDDELLRQFEIFLEALRNTSATILLVSNEVGWGIVPDNKIAREFRDKVGVLHQRIARESHEVYLLTVGLSLKIKG